VSERILFICTGNIFRSLTAEYALRTAFAGGTPVVVSSAGTEDFPHQVWSAVRKHLLARGFDVRAHVRRTLTAEILQSATQPIAMSVDHREFVARRFGRTIPLFTEACGAGAEAMPDIGEAVPDFAVNETGALAHIHATIDKIIALTPALAARIIRGTITV
jgi:protein-tyrosine phosphatase